MILHVGMVIVYYYYLVKLARCGTLVPSLYRYRYVGQG